jgi:DNA-binding response OmpR family regulator
MAKILVIDDEASILRLMAKSCTQQGHDVTAARKASRLWMC